MAVIIWNKGEKINLPYELPLQSATFFSPAVGGGAEAGGDAVAISPLIHAVHHPLTAGLNAASRRLRQLHRHAGILGGDRCHLRYRQRLSSQLHHRPPVFFHHPLHFFQMASLQRLRRHSPIQWIMVDIVPAADAKLEAILVTGFRHRKLFIIKNERRRRRRRFWWRKRNL